jgi:hypothetical protein
MASRPDDHEEVTGATLAYLAAAFAAITFGLPLLLAAFR